MAGPFPARWNRALLFAAVLAIAGVVDTQAQTAAEADVKAAFLFNFARFVTWPADDLRAGSPLLVCVAGDPAVAQALETLVKDRSIDGHGITVRRLGTEVLDGACHVLYMGGLDAVRSLRLAQTLSSGAVLTVSDADHFADRGGVAQLIRENGRMTFALNVDSAQEKRLQVSAKLLGLARLVKTGQR
jgi:YfiR/HmsC-like